MKYGEKALKRRIEKLEALLNTTKMLNSTLDTDYILDTLIEETLRLLDAGDAAILFLFNPSSNLLEVRSYTGFDREVEMVKLMPGESMTGITFAKRKPMLFQTLEEIQRAQATMTKESKELSERVLGKMPGKLKSSICCPLIYRDKCIGVIVVDNFRTDYLFTMDDLDLLQAISTQATIAIVNAINYKRDIQTMKKLEKYNTIIKEQHNKYKHSTIIHNRLTNMVLKGCTIKDIAKEISSLLNKDVIIYDSFFNIKAHSFNGETVKAEFMIDRKEVSDRLGDTLPWEYFYRVKETPVVFNPIVVSEDILGWMGIVGERLPLKEMDRITAERGRTILALEFLKQNEIQEIEQRLKGDFLENLLIDQDREYVKRCAESYGYDFTKEHCIVAMELNRKDDAVNRNDSLDRQSFIRRKNIFYITSRIVLGFFPDSIIITRGNYIVTILQLPDGDNAKPVKETIIDMVEAIIYEMSGYYSDFSISAGVGGKCSDLFELRSSYEDAMKALKILSRLPGKSPVIFFDDMEVKKFLLNNEPEELRDFVYKNLGNLLNYENSSRDEFIKTLRQYIRSNGNWSLTRQKLHIHGNTLNYRLNRIKDILGLDLDNYNDRLKIQLALEIMDFLDIS
jgi:sugar diacid utilization regulator